MKRWMAALFLVLTASAHAEWTDLMRGTVEARMFDRKPPIVFTALKVNAPMPTHVEFIVNDDCYRTPR